MTAIETRFIGPTNTRGSRITAIALGTKPKHRLTLEWDDRHDPRANHHAAAKALIVRQGWTTPEYGEWISGDGDKGAYLWVCNYRGVDKVRT